MRTAVMTALAAAVWFLPGHLAVLGLLAYIWATSLAAAGNTAKGRATELRVAALENQTAGNSTTLTAHAALITTAQSTATSAQSTANTANSTANTAQTAVNNLTGSSTSTNGLANGTINGESDQPTGGWTAFDTGPQIGGAAAHYHVIDSLGGHQHGPGSFAVASGQHSHTV